MARIRNVCPPGVFCITPTFLLLVVILFILLGYIYYITNGKKLESTIHYIAVEPKTVETKTKQVATNIQEIIIDTNSSDDRYTRAPQPTRNWLNSSPSIFNNIPVIATRGIPESYQSMGIITTSSGELLPLYGRRVASRSDRFNYYTRTDTNNPIPLPIYYKRKDCIDDVGCDELYDGETVQIAPSKQNGVATIYRFNGPSYIPNLI